MEEGASLQPTPAQSSTDTNVQATGSAPEVSPDTAITGNAGTAAPTEQPAEPSSTTTDGTEPSHPAPVVCGICNEKPGKYKCTRCKLPFCSVACNKIHKENHPPDPEPLTPAETTKNVDAPAATDAAQASTSDPKNPFGFLDDSQHLRYLFKRYPSLPRQLLAIVAETDPPAEAQHATLKEAILAKAAAAGQPRKEQWNHDVGIRKGKEALRRARKAEGDLGEGVREYTELIIHLTSQDARNREAEAVLRQQATERDADLIRKLIEEEKR